MEGVAFQSSNEHNFDAVKQEVVPEPDFSGPLVTPSDLDWITYTFDLSTLESEGDWDNMIGTKRNCMDAGLSEPTDASKYSFGSRSVRSESESTHPDVSDNDCPDFCYEADKASEYSSAQCSPMAAAPTTYYKPTKETGRSKMIRSRKRKPSDTNTVYEIGRWPGEDIRLLLEIARAYVDEELKTIGDIAVYCGIKRPSRAIDKQLKRILDYERWIMRDRDNLIRQISNRLSSGNYSDLPEHYAISLEAAKQHWTPSEP
eukprot:CAMPEP_0184523958 /NCGR_PEP_ID=MMETSP0198_2-20121128/9209_1 /TAXON_ID=1112570 /ORGANISM="Thraustochytrium sp., Strain LLF1b" /LENGTH=258 /DNA_ID=CAMNT_0026915119 /DNA_START=392 /DNA_END=1168 /DNA_ORIENTATION=-